MSISDKQVGRLWEEYKHGDRIAVHGLIVRLIEESAKEHLGAYDGSAERNRKALQKACRRFFIPYADYLAAKEGK